MSMPNPAAASYFRITLMRSAIGMPGRSKAILKTLGLHKRKSTVFHRVSPDVAGMIFKVKELIAVSEVPASETLSKRQMKELRKPDPGFWVEHAVARGPAEPR